MGHVRRGVFCTALLVLAQCKICTAVTSEESAELREEVREAFYFTYDNYMTHAFPLDELRPKSCSGENSLGDYALTLVDAMDTLAVLGNRSEFARAVQWVGKNLDFQRNVSVSLFETNIRIMGGLLSAHLLAVDPQTSMAVEGYKGELLAKALDLGKRLLPAFATPTKIPFGAVNLAEGVAVDELAITSTAAATTASLEFATLSRLTGDPAFERAAKDAVLAVWRRRSKLGLVGAHLNIITGEWTHRDAGIGTSIDSFYEYLIKAFVLLGDEEYLEIFVQAYSSAEVYLRRDPWYVEVNMHSGNMVWPVFNSLQAFWPGLQVLAGDLEKAVSTHRAFFQVWKKYGFTPEGYHLGAGSVHQKQTSYPLRPELIESTYLLYKATRDPFYLACARDFLASLQRARVRCGYAMVADVRDHSSTQDHMESFFLSETLKYLYLVFDLGAGGANFVAAGAYEYVFTTEGHPLPLTPKLANFQGQAKPQWMLEGRDLQWKVDSEAEAQAARKGGSDWLLASKCPTPAARWPLGMALTALPRHLTPRGQLPAHLKGMGLELPEHLPQGPTGHLGSELLPPSKLKKHREERVTEVLPDMKKLKVAGEKELRYEPIEAPEKDMSGVGAVLSDEEILALLMDQEEEELEESASQREAGQAGAEGEGAGKLMKGLGLGKLFEQVVGLMRAQGEAASGEAADGEMITSFGLTMKEDGGMQIVMQQREAGEAPEAGEGIAGEAAHLQLEAGDISGPAQPSQMDWAGMGWASPAQPSQMEVEIAGLAEKMKVRHAEDRIMRESEDALQKFRQMQQMLEKKEEARRKKKREEKSMDGVDLERGVAGETRGDGRARGVWGPAAAPARRPCPALHHWRAAVRCRSPTRHGWWELCARSCAALVDAEPRRWRRGHCPHGRSSTRHPAGGKMAAGVEKGADNDESAEVEAGPPVPNMKEVAAEKHGLDPKTLAQQAQEKEPLGRGQAKQPSKASRLGRDAVAEAKRNRHRVKEHMERIRQGRGQRVH